LHETSGNKPQEKNIVRGIKSLSVALNCSETKVKTMIRSKMIHEPAMWRNGRVIWFDLDKVLAMIGDDPKAKWMAVAPTSSQKPASRPNKKNMR